MRTSVLRSITLPWLPWLINLPFIIWLSLLPCLRIFFVCHGCAKEPQVFRSADISLPYSACLKSAPTFTKLKSQIPFTEHPVLDYFHWNYQELVIFLKFCETFPFMWPSPAANQSQHDTCKHFTRDLVTCLPRSGNMHSAAPRNGHTLSSTGRYKRLSEVQRYTNSSKWEVHNNDNNTTILYSSDGGVGGKAIPLQA